VVRQPLATQGVARPTDKAPQFERELLEEFARLVRESWQQTWTQTAARLTPASPSLGEDVDQRLQDGLLALLCACEPSPVTPAPTKTIKPPDQLAPLHSTGPGYGAGRGYYLGKILVIVIPFTLILAVIAAYLAVILYRRYQRRTVDAWLFGLQGVIQQYDSPQSAAAALAQLRPVYDCLAGYQPDRPVETLSDVRVCASHAMDQVAEAWRMRRESRFLPNLQPMVRDIVVGRVLTAADSVVTGRASPV
jgi:hypothetical protein